MPMNTVIQEKRRELGLTQEQVAECLHVSVPAVSKWENGSTSPDISLLPQLARLLKIDLNTLFCFQEDISYQEMGRLCVEITEAVQAGGLEAGFEAAEQRLREYPHSEALLHCLTFQLDGLLAMSGLPDGEASRYGDRLAQWYGRLARSSDGKISSSANYMLVSRCIRGGDYDRAQEILDQMPDREDVLSSMADKRMLQVNIYLHRGETEKAVKTLQNALLMAVNKVQMLLFKMIDAELASGKINTAKSIADKTEKMVELFDLWEYNSFMAPLLISCAEKDAGESIRLLRKMLAAMLTPWDMSGSPLFYSIAKPSDFKQMLPAVLHSAENDPEYAFLQSSEEFKELISEYRAITEK